jgi:hypothetical protein
MDGGFEEGDLAVSYRRDAIGDRRQVEGNDSLEAAGWANADE